jgi:hypothetical protein
MINARKYNSIFRKKIIMKVSQLKSKEDYIYIYNIIYNDIGNNVSSNCNGIFINANILSNNCIEQINDFLKSKEYESKDKEAPQIKKSYNQDNNSNNKFSNQEKSIIKRFRNSSI